MRFLKLASGYSAGVDEEDFLHCCQYLWYRDGGRVVRNSTVNGKRVKITLLREIAARMGIPADQPVAHMDRTLPMDCTRVNIREYTKIPVRPKKPKLCPQSRVKGVHAEAGVFQGYKWRVRFKINGKVRHLGWEDDQSAAEAIARRYRNSAVAMDEQHKFYDTCKEIKFDGDKYRTRIRVSGEWQRIGEFETEEEAERRFLSAAKVRLFMSGETPEDRSYKVRV